jgi:hypothetical protein
MEGHRALPYSLSAEARRALADFTKAENNMSRKDRLQKQRAILAHQIDVGAAWQSASKKSCPKI